MPSNTTSSPIVAYRLLITFLIALTLSACNSPAAKQLYENYESGIGLEKPANWSLVYSERNGITYLRAEAGIWDKDSTSIQIHGPGCHMEFDNFGDSYDEINWNIHRLQMLYELDSITVAQYPFMTNIGSHEITKATIEIPATAFRKDASREHVRNSGSATAQSIDLFQIRLLHRNNYPERVWG